jgi:hypothetical protein
MFDRPLLAALRPLLRLRRCPVHGMYRTVAIRFRITEADPLLTVDQIP